jgi:hypothetical protein
MIRLNTDSLVLNIKLKILLNQLKSNNLPLKNNKQKNRNQKNNSLRKYNKKKVHNKSNSLKFQKLNKKLILMLRNN